MFYAALWFKKDEQNRIATSITELLKFCGLTPKSGTGKMNEKLKTFLSLLMKKGYIVPIKSSRKTQAYVPTEKFNSPVRYAAIKFDEFRLISGTYMNITTGEASPHTLLLLAYLRANTFDSKRIGALKGMYYSYIKTICKKTGMTKYEIEKARLMLDKLLLIHSEKLKRYKDSYGNLHTNVTVFVEYKSSDEFFSFTERVEMAKNSVLAKQQKYLGGKNAT